MVGPARKHNPIKATQHPPRLSTSIALSEVVSAGTRFEAAAFNLEARKTVEGMRASGLRLLPVYGDSGLANFASTPIRFTRVYVDAKHGVGFLSSSEIISIRPTINYVSRKLTKKLDELLIREWDVLISRSGTVGNVGLACGRFVGLALSEHAIRLRAPKAADAGFICAFLRSKYGRLQLIQASYGSVVQHIEPEHLASVVIPESPMDRQNEIGVNMMRAAEYREEANRLIDEADAALYEHLGLKHLKKQRVRSKAPAIAKLHLRDLSWRFEASYHNHSVLNAISKLELSGCDRTTLGDKHITKEIRAVTKFRKRVYASTGGIPMLSSKQLMQIDPIDIKRLAKGAHTKDLLEIALKENMVTVSCSGTIGRVQIIPAYMEGWTANQHATRIIPADGMNAGYLYAWLASEYGQLLIRRHSYGSVILEIDKEMLGSVPIPLPKPAIRDKIGNLVLRANELRNRAWAAEQQAREQLEGLIEKRSAPVLL